MSLLHHSHLLRPLPTLARVGCSRALHTTPGLRLANTRRALAPPPGEQPHRSTALNPTVRAREGDSDSDVVGLALRGAEGPHYNGEFYCFVPPDALRQDAGRSGANERDDAGRVDYDEPHLH